MVGAFLLPVKLKILTGFFMGYMIPGNDNYTRRYATEQRVKIAGIQFAVTGTVEHSVARAKELLSLSHEQGAELVSFSALFSNPWFPSRPKADPAPFAETIPGPLTDEFRRLAGDYSMVIVLPLCERDGSRYYNSAAVIDADGTLLGVYRKVHIPQIPLWYEKGCFTPGNTGFPVFKTRYLTLGVQICWDNFFPEGSRALGLGGAQLIVAPTAAAMKTHERWQTAVAANSIANGLFCLRVNRTGSEESQDFYGESFATNPDGELIGEPAGMTDSVSLFEIDTADVDTARSMWPFFADMRPDVYRRRKGGRGAS
jgi:beta-ureidopropionase